MAESGAYLPEDLRAEWNTYEGGWAIMAGQPGTQREHMVAWVPDLNGPTTQREGYAREIVALRARVAELEKEATYRAWRERFVQPAELAPSPENE